MTEPQFLKRFGGGLYTLVFMGSGDFDTKLHSLIGKKNPIVAVRPGWVTGKNFLFESSQIDCFEYPAVFCEVQPWSFCQIYQWAARSARDHINRGEGFSIIFNKLYPALEPFG
jgi:hypothetical protein